MSEKKLTIEIRELSSSLLGKKINYCAILPENYDANDERKFPVLYLLHGLFGRFDNWLTNTKIIEYAQNFSFIIVCVDGGDNWYSDNSKLENYFYESYIFDELIPDVEQNFAVRADRNLRAIAGLSMGGYGAFKFAFRRPEMFCFAGSMSGAFHAAEVFADEKNEHWKEIHESILNVFGDDQNDARTNNNLLEIVSSFPTERVSDLPFFYFDCGLEDSFLPINIRLAEIFRQREIAFDFQIFEGGHDWVYWDAHISKILKFAAERFTD